MEYTVQKKLKRGVDNNVKNFIRIILEVEENMIVKEKNKENG